MPADVVKQKLDENHYRLEAELEPRSDARACNCHDQALCHRFCLYLFPVCALITSVFLICFAFRTPQPGIALGFSFLLLVLAMFYCVIGSLVKCWMPHSKDERYDSDSDIYDKTNVSLIVVSTDEAPELGGQGEKVWISKTGEKLMTINFDKLNYLKSLVSLNRFRKWRDFYSCCIVLYREERQGGRKKVKWKMPDDFKRFFQRCWTLISVFTENVTVTAL